jgi:hypothetical protein
MSFSNHSQYISTSFVSENEYKKNRKRQLELVPKTLKLWTSPAPFKENNASEEHTIKLDLFFYTNTQEKAQALTNALKDSLSAIEYKKATDGRKVFVITGQTKEIKMNEHLVLELVQKMTDTGFSHDCDFNGWWKAI